MSSPTLQDAIALAQEMHAGQTDKAGRPYVEHVLRVMNGVEGEAAKIVAVLHDIIEDTPITAQSLRELGYAAPIVEAIEALTKLPHEEGSDEGYRQFIERAGKNPLARPVKIADLRDNSDLSRLPSPTEADFLRLARYERALVYLLRDKP